MSFSMGVCLCVVHFLKGLSEPLYNMSKNKSHAFLEIHILATSYEACVY